jgi:hypothetical protein
VRRAVEAGSFRSGHQHYVSFGLSEGRNGNPLFNEEFYLQNNVDVAAAVNAQILPSGYFHYVMFGRAEGRRPA